MNIIVKLLGLAIIFSTITFSTLAQEKCGTEWIQQQMKDQNLIPQDDQIFENWIKKKIESRKAARSHRTNTPPYKIPVVVHVIHKGEPVGQGSNIPDAQIISQIKVLNEDFQRLNADASQTPELFQSVAGSLDIEFVLAKRDPEGLPTNGIVRVQGSQSGWTGADNYKLKSQSYWPAEDYLNIWVCDLVDQLIGYAQLPISNEVAGLENSSINRLTDGVVSWYKAFGSIDDGAFALDPQFNKGRTVTHEVGHFFGLHHIWGNDGGGCGGTDYVDDTPNQAGSTNGCPSHPRSDNCGSAKMFQNFMDYTDDLCMNLFTQGQVDRMIAVLDNSPRRASLTSSAASEEPIFVNHDLGIRSVITPGVSQCHDPFQPVVQVRNYGSNTITSTTIQLYLNSVLVQAKNFNVSLEYLDVTNVMFDPVNVSLGPSTISFTIIETNGMTDGNPDNDSRSIIFNVPETVSTPFTETFTSMPETWLIENQDGMRTWETRNAVNTLPGNKAVYMDFFNYDESEGEVDVLYSPVFDLTDIPAALLMFDVAYARYQNSNDQLQVILLRDCQPLSEGTVIYDKKGSALATTSPTTSSFVPNEISDWRQEIVSLVAFAGESHVQLAFVGISDWGNNLYLDNISVITNNFVNIVLSDISSPSFVTCDNTPPLKIVIKNEGTTVQTFRINVTVNNELVQDITVTNLNFHPGEVQTLELEDLNLSIGTNQLSVSITEPNHTTDATPGDNVIKTQVIVNRSADVIPLRETFDGDFSGRWILGNPRGGMEWQTRKTNFRTSVFFNAFNNQDIGDEAWLVSPVLDFTHAIDPYMSFDLSHRMVLNRKENLQIMISTDCGNTFEPLLSLPFNSSTIDAEWFPNDEDDWIKDLTVSLAAYKGMSDVRLAFVVSNQNGNNLFIDNINFFSTEKSGVILTEAVTIFGYNMSDPTQSEFKISFNLENRQDVPFQVVDMMGHQHAAGVLENVLNQTFSLDFANELAAGIYIIRTKIDGRFQSKRIHIWNPRK